jgi:hypothetical protein
MAIHQCGKHGVESLRFPFGTISLYLSLDFEERIQRLKKAKGISAKDQIIFWYTEWLKDDFNGSKHFRDIRYTLYLLALALAKRGKILGGIYIAPLLLYRVVTFAKQLNADISEAELKLKSAELELKSLQRAACDANSIRAISQSATNP